MSLDIALSTDVVVVGGGYAGLAAALHLKDAGVPAVLLEAAGRVGGRVHSEHRQRGLVVDHGGQWVGPTQKHLLALADRFGCGLFPTYEDGQHIEVWQDGTRRPYTGALPEAGPGVAEYLRVTALLDALAAEVDVEAPWLTARLAEWDGQSAEAFFRAQTSDADALARLALAIQGVWSAEPREISLFHVLFYIRSAGSFTELMETRDCAQDSRFTGGADAPARAIAAALGPAVHTGSAARSIYHPARGAVTVHCDRGGVSARRAIVALPPTALARVEFRPALPPSRAGWLAHARMGRVAKAHAVYPEPFWRDEGLSGIATLYGDSRVGVVFDNSPADASAGVLVAFVYGDRVSDWSGQPAGQRRAEILAALASVAGQRAGAPADYTERIWTDDPYARGGYEAFMPPGAWSAFGESGWRAATPTGIHWAGTETSSQWNGYIDGAIRSGQRAAGEVLAELASEH
ncbi:MAG TPA: FAD-dependent oxidoreductase [Trebonia sp.]|nr:FAD-dependent oxidoreductase [Trebonia sp.]